MKIGIDARSILNPEKNPEIGVGHYTYQLIRHLLKMDQENEYVLFFDYRVREKDVKKFTQKNVKIKYFPFSDYKKYLPGAYSELLGLATVAKNDLDVLHITSPDARVPVGYSGKVVCTFQDLAVYVKPELVSRVKKVKARYNRSAMAKRANKIIAVSESTKKDLEQFLKTPEEKISVIHNGVDERFFQEVVISKEELKKELKSKFDIDKKFILFIGTLDPTKNIARLLESFKKIQEKRGRGEYQLVIGGKKGWLADSYIQIAEDLEISEDVKFLGYVEGDDLRKLFKGASLFAMPSLYEGFGVTVLEAMASGLPCLVSNLAPLKEITKGTVEFIDPLNTDDMAIKAEALLEDGEKQMTMAGEGVAVAKDYSWFDCAEKTLEIYKKTSEKK